ncbi:MAG: FHA domain-containing protein [Myxococcales bacterium]|nr:FHA domain-containing protein [Myxococcales bacterium]
MTRPARLPFSTPFIGAGAPSAAEPAAAPDPVAAHLPADYRELVRRTTRAIFIAHCPFLLLVNRASLMRAARVPRTLTSTDVQDGDARALVLALRKSTGPFPSIITLGRTAHSDLAIPDVTISKVHAYFRVTDGRVEVTDAGSSNGSWLLGQRLPVQGAPREVPMGATLLFGRVELALCDAAGCWDLIHPGEPHVFRRR